MATDVTQLPDWGAPPPSIPAGRKLTVGAFLFSPIVAFSVVFVFLDGPWSLGAVVGSFLWLLFLVANEWRATTRRLLRGARIEPLTDARFTNLVGGLAQRYQLPLPELGLIHDDRPNAVVTRRPRPRLIVSSSLLETYTRTEQEAVAAHCLHRLASGSLGLTHLAAALGRSGSRFAPKVGYEDDIGAAALTRYPPALAAAIRKAKPASGPSAPFWFVAHDVSHRHPTERIAALEDL